MPRQSILDVYFDTELILVVILITGALLWAVIIQPLIVAMQTGVQSLSIWFQENTVNIGIVFFVIIGMLVAIYLLNRSSRLHREEELGMLQQQQNIQIEHERVERQAYEMQQEQLQQQAEQERLQKEQASEMDMIAKGYRKYKGRWGNPAEIDAWKKADEEARLKSKDPLTTQFNEVKKAIEEFRPSRIYRDEYGYHSELQGWLRSRFPDSEVELQTGGSRPDIIIGRIAIEVKGPTTDQAIKTLAEKYIKYLNYYNYLIYALFEPSYSERKFKEIREGIEKDVRVKIIIKNQCYQCLALVPEGARFCPSCGISIS